MSAEYLRQRIRQLETRSETDPHFSFADAQLLDGFRTRLRQLGGTNSPKKKRANSPRRNRGYHSPSHRRRSTSRNRSRSRSPARRRNNNNSNRAPRTPPIAPDSFFYNEYLQSDSDSNSSSNSNSNSLPPVDVFLPERSQANADSAWLRSYFGKLESALGMTK